MIAPQHKLSKTSDGTSSQASDKASSQTSGSGSDPSLQELDQRHEAQPLSPLANLTTTRAVLDAHGLSTKYSFGQNFLVNAAIVQKIVDLAQLAKTDAVLEVGPGIGTLTIALLKQAGRVTSVEIDADLPQVLEETCAPWKQQFALIQKDALDLTLADLQHVQGGILPTKFVANLPYAVAATVVLDYFQRFPSIQSATVMVQKEVADRMAATLGNKNYGAYTVKLRLLTQVAGRFSVSPGNFFPPPRVESSVIRLDRRCACNESGKALSPELIQAASRMADAAFASRRKTIANSFKTYFSGREAQARLDADQCAQLFDAAGIDPKRRGETLSLDEFIRLGQEYLALSL